MNHKGKLSLAIQICQEINSLHKNPLQIIHRDIKLANILFSVSKQMKICDFGIAKVKSLLNSQLAITLGRRKIVETPLNMAPEMLLDHEGDTEASSFWSLEKKCGPLSY